MRMRVTKWLQVSLCPHSSISCAALRHGRSLCSWDRGRFSVPRRKQQMNHTITARGANPLPAPRFAITLIFSPFFLETYHNDNSLYVKVLKFYLMWINSKKIRCTIRLWSKRIYLNHTDRAQSTFWRGLVVCLKRMMIYDYSF